ncbi:MAG: endonuclease [Frankiales bacterium]|nr:endonuclease [Frankiales bacterium]
MCSMSDVLGALDALGSTDPGLLQLPGLVASLARVQAAATGHYLRRLGELDASGEFEVEGAATTAAWVRRETGKSEREARDDVRLARRLRQLPVVQAASIAGDLPPQTVELVARVAMLLPEELRAATEPALVDAARLMTYEQLRRFLSEKVASLAPDQLKDAIETAYERRRLYLDPLGDMGEVRGSLEPLVAEQLDVVLNALMESDRRADETRTIAQRRADALRLMVEMVCELPEMPQVREALPQLIVVSEEGKPAHTTGGNVLSEGQLDLVRCASDVTTVVVSPGRRPLDVGRSARSVGRRVWLAIVVRDEGHCQVAGCSAPASRCVPHHIVPWRLGGGTDLDNLVLLCVAHHHALHDREINLILYDGRTLTPTGGLPVGAGPPPRRSRHLQVA